MDEVLVAGTCRGTEHLTYEKLLTPHLAVAISSRSSDECTKAFVHKHVICLQATLDMYKSCNTGDSA